MFILIHTSKGAAHGGGLPWSSDPDIQVPLTRTKRPSWLHCHAARSVATRTSRRPLQIVRVALFFFRPPPFSRRLLRATMIDYPLHFNTATGFPFKYQRYSDDAAGKVLELLDNLFPRRASQAHTSSTTVQASSYILPYTRPRCPIAR